MGVFPENLFQPLPAAIGLFLGHFRAAESEQFLDFFHGKIQAVIFQQRLASGIEGSNGHFEQFLFFGGEYLGFHGFCCAVMVFRFQFQGGVFFSPVGDPVPFYDCVEIGAQSAFPLESALAQVPVEYADCFLENILPIFEVAAVFLDVTNGPLPQGGVGVKLVQGPVPLFGLATPDGFYQLAVGVFHIIGAEQPGMVPTCKGQK